MKTMQDDIQSVLYTEQQLKECVQKIADGEPLGGSAPSAKSVFKAVQAQPTPAAGSVNPLTGQPM